MAGAAHGAARFPAPARAAASCARFIPGSASCPRPRAPAAPATTTPAGAPCPRPASPRECVARAFAGRGLYGGEIHASLRRKHLQLLELLVRGQHVALGVIDDELQCFRR